MLKKTFCHVKGITRAIEKVLWDSGIEDWSDFFAKAQEIKHLPESKRKEIEEELIRSEKALSEGNLQYFKTLLNPKEHWRLANHGKIAFVDIETTGLSKFNDEITILGIYDGTTPHIYVNGKNLPEAKEKLKEFDLVVTFNGKQFDIPFIEQYFSHTYNFIHLDLRYMLKELGLQGGLKKIERELGITRDAAVASIDGFEAINLWNAYKRGDQNALKTLLKYNEEDIVNLKALLDHYLIEKTKKAEKQEPVALV